MTYDILLVTGILLVMLSVPSLISALSDKRRPRVAAVVLIVGGVLIAVAANAWPGDFGMRAVPDAIYRVIGAMLR